MKTLHVVPGLDDPSNGFAIAARLIAQSQGADLIDARQFHPNNRVIHATEQYSAVWVHGMWTPDKWLACWKVLHDRNRQSSEAKRQPLLVRMLHGSLSPVYLKYQGKWKKRLVGPIERWLLRHSDRIVATCEAEREWIRAYVGKGCPEEIVVEDLKRFFDLDEPKSKPGAEVGRRNLHVLYLGRRHPLKGVALLERAVCAFNQSISQSVNSLIDLRIVSNTFGEEKEAVWNWCDVLCLPTLSENFGLVVAEALERGKRVVTTDGAPVWGEGEMSECSECPNVRIGYGGRLIYLKGYRDGTDERRVELLKCAIERLA